MDHVDLDDSKVIDVERLDDSLTITLQREGKQILVKVAGLEREDAECFVGDRIKGVHPDPKLPVVEIEVAEMGPGILELQGGRYPETDWYVWRIVANSIEIQRQ